MNVIFQIHYRAEYGQSLCVIEAQGVKGQKVLSGWKPEVNGRQQEPAVGWTEESPLVLNCQGTEFWTAMVPVSDIVDKITYKYAVRKADGSYLYEDGLPRVLDLRGQAWAAMKGRALVVRDAWQDRGYDDNFCTKVFTEALFRRKGEKIRGLEIRGSRVKSRESSVESNVKLSIVMPQVLPTQGVAIIGDCDDLGNWDPERKKIMSDADYPVWRAELGVKDREKVEYKYVVYDLESGNIIDTEWGENREVWGVAPELVIAQNDRHFRRNEARWKGAGVAVPVFSLRTEEDFGIGEFSDLKKLAEWVAATGQKMIQTLPINDTTISHTNHDSYPYNAVSVFALHPIYLNVPQMGALTAAQKKKYAAEQASFNKKDFADYQAVLDAKMVYFKALFKRDGEALMATNEFKLFAQKNAPWLPDYANFMSQRDREPAEFYMYLQYHADKQLREAVDYAHSSGVAIKGDIPIGIAPESVDAAKHPELFHLDASAGAPPDDFSIKGQNWGFPTYNWEKMAEDGYGWWKARFHKMQDYFDAYRIDHILGFFRIWQMRKTDVWGLCGHFVPALPYTYEEICDQGVCLSCERLTKPYVRSTFLSSVLGYEAEWVKRNVLQTRDNYAYEFKPAFDTQVKVQQWYERLMSDEKQLKASGLNAESALRVRDGLMRLLCEVLMVEDQSRPGMYHPRIATYQSYTFNELYGDQKEALMRIYNDYFYRRHITFWRESAMRKLPALIDSTQMLCCGEDLGMVPACVPDVMHELQILSLEIQRMPKDPTARFAHPTNAPYLSVCTTGTHDMNPLRAWWEEDREVTQRFYHEQMGWWGDAPVKMTPEIVEFIINQHMYSPAMWSILPLQDWMALDEELWVANPQSERINTPDNPDNFWSYRMHVQLEELLTRKKLNDKIKALTSVR